MTITEIIASLNNYEGDNIWQDIILNLDYYDEARSDAIDIGANDRFALTSGDVILWDASARSWYLYLGTLSDLSA